MKKLIATGTVAVLLLAGASSPAMAQVTSEVEGDDNDTFTAQFVDASQFQFALQGQFGDANAIGNENVAVVASDQGITQNQANAGLGEISDLNQGGDGVGDLFVD